MAINRRIMLGGMAAAAGLAGTGSVRAQAEWPSARPIRMMVPFSAGGTTDNSARIYCQKLQEVLGQSVVVENRGGAGGALAFSAVARAAPDGYTLIWATLGGLAIQPQMSKVPYDPIKDFEPVARVSDPLSAFVVRPSLGVNNVAEFVALAKKEPEKLNYGSSGSGTVTHIRGAMLEKVAGIKMTHVPFKGGGEALASLLSGTTHLMIEGTVLPQVRNGDLKLLAILGAERHPEFPDVPTMAEALPGYDVPGWHGVMAPAGTPKPVVDRLARELSGISDKADVKQALLRAALLPMKDTPEGTRTALAEATKVYAEIVRDLNLKMN